ncbi:MAG: hypothetical protein IKL08_04350 [Clostridia bacterium]|nr:hypothetical protein [Clostridia bacterium]
MFVNETSFLARGKDIFPSLYNLAMHLAELGYPKRKDISIIKVASFGILNILDNILDIPNDKLYIRLVFINISVINK